MRETIGAYARGELPPSFRYPDAFLEYATIASPKDLYPWFFFRPDGEVGKLALSIAVTSTRKLVPFASLEGGDGDTACFDGVDTSGNPRVIMLVTDGSGRQYSYTDFDDWLEHARADAKNWVENSPG